jgi:hypothetical protein
MPERSKSATFDDCNTNYITCKNSSIDFTANDSNSTYEELDTAYDEPNTTYDGLISSDNNFTATTGTFLDTRINQ